MNKQTLKYSNQLNFIKLFVITSLFWSCSSSSSNNNSSTISFNLELKSPDQSDLFPDDLNKALVDFENNCIDHTRNISVDLRERKIDQLLKSYKGQIQIDEGDGVGAALNFGGLLKNTVSDAYSQMSSGLMNSDMKEGLIKKVKSLNQVTKETLEKNIEQITNSCEFASRSRSFKLFLPKSSNSTKILTKATFETVGPLQYPKEYGQLLSHLQLIEFIETIEQKKNENYDLIFKMRYFIYRNEFENRTKILAQIKEGIDKPNFNINTGNNDLNKKLTSLNELLLTMNNKPTEIDKFLKFASEETQKQFNQYIDKTREDILSFFNDK